MNIIIPIGGKGERFYKEGYSDPKPLIHILNKEMIFHVLDNLSFHKDDCIFIIYNTNLDAFDFSKKVKLKYPNLILIPIDYQTSGAVETISFGLGKICKLTKNKRCVLLDCDTFYKENILEKIRSRTTNLVFYTKKYVELPIYSYIEMDSCGKIKQIKEKEKISCNANTGCYVFNDISQLTEYCMKNKITYNGEPYTSCVIAEMITDQHDFFGYELENEYIFSVGTPSELKMYIDKTFVFLFDLDGTVVNTDSIYFKVWKQILAEYKIDLTSELFNNYIYGNSDDRVVNMLIPSANVSYISEKKDRLFIEHIDEVSIIDGVQDYFNSLLKSGYLCSIVTNCNRLVAEKIIEHCGLSLSIDFLVIGSECDRPKPFPDPYLNAISRYKTTPNKCIIFEDSKSGLLSARLSNPLCVIGITTNYIKSELMENGAGMTIDNYKNLNTSQILSYNKLSMENIKMHIINSLNYKILEIVIDENKLKGGYISDVLALTIKTDEKTMECVLKLENKNDTKLSIIARKLGLYVRENYFYSNISQYVNIDVPLFYGLIKDDDFNIIGILMENLYATGKYIVNLNLNNNINVSLQIIEKLAAFHCKFWNKNINKAFPELKKHNDSLFNPVWKQFIVKNWDTFKLNWTNIITDKQMMVAEDIMNNFGEIQDRLSNSNLTLIHGDVKSPNIFYNTTKNYGPVFLDWQYVAIGKGVQDVIFFLIESFDIHNIALNYPIFKNYYYQQILQRGITDYSYTEYEADIKDAIRYFPFFVAIWFGTTPQDELIDKNFPFFFIQKLFQLEMIINVH